MLMPRRLGVVFGVNQVVFAELGDDGTWRTIVSSDTSMGGVIADPTGTGELTDDGRYLWAAQIEACLFAAAVATDPARPIPMPRDLPAHAHRLALRERQASTWRELTQLRGALGDPTVLPLSRYVQVETGGRSGSPVALGHHPDPAAWASLDFRLRGKSVRIDTLGADGVPRFAAGRRDARQHVLGRTVADHVAATWLSTHDPSMEGPRRGLSRARAVHTDAGLIRYVGRSVDAMESAWPLLVFSQKEGLDDLLRRAKEIGAPEIACLAAMPKRTASDVLHGHAEPGPETIARIADAVARAVPRTCPACAEHFYGRRDQTTCGAARCRMRLLRARRRASITESVEALRTLGGAVPADRTWEERSPAWVEVAAFEGGAQ